MAEDAWNTREPVRVSLAYTPDSVWRNRAEFLVGRDAIVQFLVRKCANRFCRCMAIAAQQLKSGGLRNAAIVLRVFGVDLCDNGPCHIRNGVATGNGACDIDLDGIHGADMVDDNSDGPTIATRYGRLPFGFG